MYIDLRRNRNEMFEDYGVHALFNLKHSTEFSVKIDQAGFLLQ
jgi:hypothetical protein